MSKDLLFELGTEDVPPDALPEVANNLEDSLIETLREESVSFADASLYYTPRRMAVLLTDVAESQEDRVETQKGPPEEIGLEEDGSYSPAAEGFARGFGVSPDDLYVKETEQGEYFFFDQHIEGQDTSRILKQALPQLVRDLAQPETMRWGEEDPEFIRPIRWVLCLWGEEVVNFRLGSINSDRRSRGHRFMDSNEAIELDQPNDYEQLLEDHFVLADPQKRFDRMKQALRETGEKVGGEIALDDEFLELLANSLEYPTPIEGDFPRTYLTLPPILVFTTLKKEARLMPFVAADGTPKTTFVGFRDGGADEEGVIKKGYEAVINARLRDSKFFFEHDREQRLEDYVEELRDVTFQQELGSVWDKIERMKEIANQLNEQARLGRKDQTERTIELCKADLATEVVDEFPTLQGEIGAIYAQLDGEEPPVVTGIREHYLPEKSGGKVPSSETGILAGIADKFDTVFGSFLLGERPTGTRDPYGLRRKTNGIIRTLIENSLEVNLFSLVAATAPLFDFEDKKETKTDFRKYLQERLESLLQRSYGVGYDIAEAVIAVDGGRFYDTYCKARALEECRDQRELQELIVSFERVMNITEGKKEDGYSEPNPELFKKEEEELLWQATRDKRRDTKELIAEKSYAQALESMLELKELIDSYFDGVMVMAEEEELRRNRLATLWEVRDLFLKVGDLSRIVAD